jgi:signal transduction histidine kinase
MAWDITARKQMEEALRESEQRYRQLFEHVPISIWQEDLTPISRWFDALHVQGIDDLRAHVIEHPQELRSVLAEVPLRDANTAALTLFGARDVRELREKRTTVFCEESYDYFLEGVVAFWMGRTEFESPAQALSLDGRRIDLLNRVLVPLESGRPRWADTVIAMIDMTDRNRAEELARRRGAEVAHMSRLSVMGEMATELAHELNQPLAAIANYARGCLHRLESGEYGARTLLEAIRKIVAEAERTDEVIRRIRDFARRHETCRSATDLNATVRQAIQFVEYEMRSRNISVQLDGAASIPSIEIDGIQIQQVLLNLLRNAIDAMANTEGRPRCLRVTTAMDGEDTVRVSVSDTGEGFTAEQAERLFEPFHTTKPEGTGLGLSISRSIIQAHGGRLWAELNDGPGATFHFTLPVTAAVR